MLVPKSHVLSCHFATSPRHCDHHSGTQIKNIYLKEHRPDHHWYYIMLYIILYYIYTHLFSKTKKTWYHMISPLFHSEIPWKFPIISWFSRSIIHLIFPAPQPSEPSQYRPVGLASPGRPNLAPAQDHRDDTNLPSGKHTKLWKITMFNGKIHYKWPFSIAMLVYQRVFIECFKRFILKSASHGFHFCVSV